MQHAFRRFAFPTAPVAWAMSVFERRVLDAIPNTIYTTDLAGNLTSVNRAGSRVAEPNGADEVRGRTIWSAIGDPAAREQIEHGTELLRTGRATEVTWELPCNTSDADRILLMQMAPLHEDHAVTGFVFSVTDITPSHRARAALLDIGVALSATIELDRVFHEVSHQIRRVIPYDRFVIALMDDTAGELCMAYSAGHHADDAREIEARLRPRWLGALADGRVLVHQAQGAVELTAPMTDTDGALGAMTLLTESIENTQRLHEAERALSTIAVQAAVAIERAGLVRRVENRRRLETIGEVAAGIANELRNPLFGISSAAQLLRFRSREDPVLERNVGRILREVERLNGMVTDLLEYGRPRPLALAEGDPDSVWDEVLEGNRGLLESKSLVLQRTRTVPPARCLVDAEHLAQVLLNVLTNAVDAAPEGSDLTLTSTMLPSGAWRSALHNDGDPVPPDILPRVFEIFLSTKQGGTGIGLALCRRILDEHGGTIALDSAPTRGTTLTITLPAAASASTPARQPAE